MKTQAFNINQFAIVFKPSDIKIKTFLNHDNDGPWQFLANLMCKFRKVCKLLFNSLYGNKLRI